jgi:hypothetical protein
LEVHRRLTSLISPANVRDYCWSLNFSQRQSCRDARIRHGDDCRRDRIITMNARMGVAGIRNGAARRAPATGQLALDVRGSVDQPLSANGYALT